MRTLKDLNLTDEEFEAIKEEMNTKKTKDIYNEYKKEILSHREYVGKCYKENDKEKYIMVISGNGSNQFRVDALTFEFPVKFKKDYHLTKMFRAENIFANLEFDGITVEDYPLFCNNLLLKRGKGPRVLDCLEEITKEEYYKQMDRYIAELKKVLDSGEIDLAKELENKKDL